MWRSNDVVVLSYIKAKKWMKPNIFVVGRRVFKFGLETIATPFFVVCLSIQRASSSLMWIKQVDVVFCMFEPERR